jgi:molecular chaperone GrpE
MEQKNDKIEKEIEKLKKKLEECQKEKNEYLAGWQRARADFLNYKKEEMERIKEILKYGQEEFILKILPILDNLELAEKKIPEDLKENEYVKGLLKVKIQFQDFLKNQGVKEIETKIGESFDPNFQEVVEEVDKKEKSGKIVEILEKGYKLHEKIIRPAKVKVGK